MSQVETIREGWMKRGRFRPVIPYPRITDDGLVLGASTTLAQKSAGGDLTFTGRERRILALLSAAYGTAISSDTLVPLRRAARAWAKGDKSLAAILIAQMGLPKLTEGDDGTYRLFMAAGLIDDGLDPATLLKAWNIGTEALDRFDKFNPNHDELGRFASGVGSATAVEHAVEARNKKSPWLHHPNPEIREKLAEMESSADKPNGGYDQRNKTTNALGRYQLLKSALQDAGWKDADGLWTAKAQAAGVSSDDDFLKNPKAQEQALTDVLQRDTEQLRAKHLYDRVGSTIITGDGSKIDITEAGLLAAAHKEGAGHVHAYFTWIDGLNGNAPATYPDRWYKNIEGRLRNAADTPYDRAATVAHTTLPGRKIAR